MHSNFNFTKVIRTTRFLYNYRYYVMHNLYTVNNPVYKNVHYL